MDLLRSFLLGGAAGSIAAKSARFPFPKRLGERWSLNPEGKGGKKAAGFRWSDGPGRPPQKDQKNGT